MTRARVASGFLSQEEADALVREYESDINRYTYLE
jgi:arginine decarboxylase-like protein